MKNCFHSLEHVFELHRVSHSIHNLFILYTKHLLHEWPTLSNCPKVYATNQTYSTTNHAVQCGQVREREREREKNESEWEKRKRERETRTKRDRQTERASEWGYANELLKTWVETFNYTQDEFGWMKKKQWDKQKEDIYKHSVYLKQTNNNCYRDVNVHSKLGPCHNAQHLSSNASLPPNIIIHAQFHLYSEHRT